ncbi:MAG: M67 family metallopeptidase [Gemmatimonadota bacterium]
MTRPDSGLGKAGLVVSGALARSLFRSLEAAYPREACGVLTGRIEAGARRVLEVHPSANLWADRPDRYRVDPADLRRLIEAEERGGARVLGFYHSHPDAPPEPSETDRRLAWPWYHYLIISVTGGVAGEARVWELTEGAGFGERPLREE